MAENHKITPKLSERFSDLFGADDLSNHMPVDEGTFPVYLEESRKLSLNKLLHLAPYSEVLLLLGEQGVGKTTLLKVFVERAATTWRIGYVSATPLIDGSAFLRQASKGLGLDLDNIGSTEDLLWELDRYLQAVGRSGRRAIIIVDDAHLLRDDAIHLAEKILLDERTNNSVSLVLSMRQDQGAKLDRFAILKDRLAYTLTLEPFTKKEIEGYLRHHLAGSTAQLEALLTPEVIATIHQKSGGIPDEINAIAHGLLTEKKRGAAANAKKKSLFAGALVAAIGVVAGAVLYYQDEINQMLEMPVEQELAADNNDATETLAGNSVTQMAPEALTDSTGAVVVLQDNEKVPVSIPLPDEDQSEGVQQAPAQGVELAAVPEPQTSGPVALEVTAPSAEAKQPPAQAKVDATAALKAVPEPTPKAKPKPVPPAKVELSPQLQWLMAQADSHYTLQLMALVDKKTVQGYVDQWKIADQSATFPITRRGKVLTVLVYGSYPSRADATRAAGNLPRSWEVGQPWIRTFSSVRKDLAEK